MGRQSAVASWCILTDLMHKSHDAPVPYYTMHHFVTEMCTFLVQNGALWDVCLMHCGICDLGLLHPIIKVETEQNPKYSNDLARIAPCLISPTELLFVTRLFNFTTKVLLIHFKSKSAEPSHGSCYAKFYSFLKDIAFVFAYHISLLKMADEISWQIERQRKSK